MRECPNARKYKSAKQISVIYLKLGKKVNISRDWGIEIGRKKNGRNMQHFNIVIDRRKIGTNFIFQGLRNERSKLFLHLVLFN